MSTKIEKVGRNRYQFRCTICGPIDDGSDLDILRYLQELHEATCRGKKGEIAAK